MPSPEHVRGRPPASAEAPVVLVVLDGWGHAPPGPGNAITSAGFPRLAGMAAFGEPCLLEASGRAVGLPDGVMGNSEVGHLTMGAGRVVDQDLVRIGDACSQGLFASNPAFVEVVRAAKSGSGRLHLLGLCSDAGVHSDLAHLVALARAASELGVTTVLAHAFTDGRDTAPDSSPRFLARLERELSEVPNARIATVGGRWHAMDRDQRWERVATAWRTLVDGEGPRAGSASAVVAAAHAAGVTDEFVPPTLVAPDGTIRDGDAVLFTNFRADRARQLSRALASDRFDGFERRRRPRLAAFATMTSYASDIDALVLFGPQSPRRTLGEVFADASWPQMRLAETEKYAHVTYFLNGGREEPFAGEERVLVPSPQVATYDLEPAMAAPALTAQATSWIARGGRRLLVVNYANADMVGHSGALVPTIHACRLVDACVGAVADAVRNAGGALVVTADHGKAEVMLDDRGMPHTAHTTSPVPVVVLDAARGRRLGATKGGLKDVAPTLLALAGLEVPDVMTGRSLLA